MAEVVTLASADEIDPGEGIAASVEGVAVARFTVAGAFHAFENACAHVGGSLGNGRLSGTTVKCPLHGATSDGTTGEVGRPPAEESVTAFPVEVVDGEVRLARPPA